MPEATKVYQELRYKTKRGWGEGVWLPDIKRIEVSFGHGSAGVYLLTLNRGDGWVMKYYICYYLS